jgi:uncharacterized protein YdhG (YjbR/CyaY superfamily)
MKAVSKELKTIDDYISNQVESKQIGLQTIRAIIKKVAPKATEGISYQMPVFKQNGNLVYFAAAKNHYGFYPMPKTIETFKVQLNAKGYLYSKGAIQFPIDKPIPSTLIQAMVKFRIKENEIKSVAKEKAKAHKNLSKKAMTNKVTKNI